MQDMAQSPIDETVMIAVRPEHSGALRRMLSVWFGRWWWLVVLVLFIPTCIAMTVDPRWWYVTFMIALMVYPTIIWIVYSFYGTLPGASLLYYLKIIDIDSLSITISYENYFSEEEELSFEDIDKPAEFIKKVIMIDEISGCTVNATSLTIEWSDKVWDYIKIPLSAFHDEVTAKRVSERLLDAAYKNRWHNK